MTDLRGLGAHSGVPSSQSRPHNAINEGGVIHLRDGRRVVFACKVGLDVANAFTT
jgi:hypothetical protein